MVENNKLRPIILLILCNLDNNNNETVCVLDVASFDADALDLINIALEYYRVHTCLNLIYFDENETPPTSGNYIMVTGDASGCSSHIGSVKAPQFLSLGTGCRVSSEE